ncbi:phage holin family protein [Chitinophagaceae bacterium LWZ2-11]
MLHFLSKTLISSVAVLLAAYLLSGVYVKDTWSAILVAAVLGLLNSFVKPILIILTLPITVFTLGIFLLVINILIVKWVSEIVPGFRVNSWWSALLFSIIVSVVTALIQGLIDKQRKSADQQ